MASQRRKSASRMVGGGRSASRTGRVHLPNWNRAPSPRQAHFHQSHSMTFSDLNGRSEEVDARRFCFASGSKANRDRSPGHKIITSVPVGVRLKRGSILKELRDINTIKMADFLYFILFCFLVFSFFAPLGASQGKRLMTAALFCALTIHFQANENRKRRDKYVLYSKVGFDRTFRKRSPSYLLTITTTSSIVTSFYAYL